MSTIDQIERQLSSQLPALNKRISPKDYFQQCAVYLKHAGEAKKHSDLETAYANLRAYIIVIEEVLPSHPDIKKHMDEWKFNNDKVHALKNEISNIKRQLEEAMEESEAKALPKTPSQQTVQKFVTHQHQTHLQPKVEPKPYIPERKPSVFNRTPEESPVIEKSPEKPKPLMPERKSSVFQKKTEEVGGQMIEKIGNNEKVQEKVGSGISKLARNEKVQEKVADNINNTVKDEKFKRGMGETIAKQTDSEILKKLATNEKIQDAVSVSIQKTIGNKEMQKKIGNKVAEMAEDKETQKKVAKGLVSVGKGALKGGKVIGIGLYNTAKFAYEESKKKEGEEQPQQQKEEESTEETQE